MYGNDLSFFTRSIRKYRHTEQRKYTQLSVIISQICNAQYSTGTPENTWLFSRQWENPNLVEQWASVRKFFETPIHIPTKDWYRIIFISKKIQMWCRYCYFLMFKIKKPSAKITKKCLEISKPRSDLLSNKNNSVPSFCFQKHWKTKWNFSQTPIVELNQGFLTTSKILFITHTYVHILALVACMHHFYVMCTPNKEIGVFLKWKGNSVISVNQINHWIMN